jgi:hypothetical protein
VVDIRDAAELAAFSYQEAGVPDAPAGWVPFTRSVQLSSGFTGNSFYNEETNTLVIGYGGTATIGDFVADGEMAILKQIA